MDSLNRTADDSGEWGEKVDVEAPTNDTNPVEPKLVHIYDGHLVNCTYYLLLEIG